MRTGDERRERGGGLERVRLGNENGRENERYERREEMLERMRLGYENRRERARGRGESG